ncbi:MAG: hypothetical protein ACOX05_01645 [Bacillota bacterium]|jgi:hypothetical protein
MLKLHKILIISLTLMTGMFLLIGCDANNTDNNQAPSATTTNQTSSEEVDLISTYSLSTDKISIWYLEGEIGLPEDDGGYTVAFEITDASDIEKMMQSVDFNSWQKAAQKASGQISYYIQFGDNGTIGIIDEEAFGYIGKGSVAKNGSLSDYEGEGLGDGPYHMSQTLPDTLKEMIEKYQPELLATE